MKLIIAVIISSVAFSAFCQNTKDYRPLLAELNKMLDNAEEFNYVFEPDFKVLQPYQIDENGILSVIIKGNWDGKELTRKYAAPFNDIDDFVRDIYLVLTFKNESVTVAELKNGEWETASNIDFFHLGKPSDSDATTVTRAIRRELKILVPDLKNEYEWMD